MIASACIAATDIIVYNEIAYPGTPYQILDRCLICADREHSQFPG
jgi:hypothetical protein